MVRKFGKIVVKPSKANPKWIEASYLTPVSAFSEWPDLPNRQTATFPCTQDGRDEAAAWLTRARRRIELTCGSRSASSSARPRTLP